MVLVLVIIYMAAGYWAMGKTIYANKIKMILNPKDFYAEGNTKTVIKNIQSSDLEGNK